MPNDFLNCNTRLLTERIAEHALSTTTEGEPCTVVNCFRKFVEMTNTGFPIKSRDSASFMGLRMSKTMGHDLAVMVKAGRDDV